MCLYALCVLMPWHNIGYKHQLLGLGLTVGIPGVIDQ